MKMNAHFLRTSVVVIVLGLITPLYATVIAIGTDTYIDSQSPNNNYCASGSAKVVVNGNDGSLTRVLFQLPAEVLSVPVSQIITAKVWFYTFNDLTASRTVQLHSLTTGFVENGATWNTNGMTGWSNAGGDYGLNTSVDAVKSTNWFSWDITSLLNDTNLRSFGAMLKMGDESNPGTGNMPRASFTSSNGTTAGQRPYVEVTYVPEPASLVIFGLLTVVGIVKRTH